MDNLTHTLVGLVLAEAGLKHRSRFGTAVLIVGANLPDLDALIYVAGSSTDALAFRRGWTHGVLAMAVLPLLLTGAALGWSRLLGHGDKDQPGAPLHPGRLLALAAIAIWSHPLLDLLNTYGVRLLMPFSGRWFYGDALFIVDPWVWAALALGIVLSRRRHSGRPARVALAASVVYALVMAASSRMGRAAVTRHAGTAQRTMVAPLPGTPFRRDVIRDLGDRYEFGALALAGWKYSSIVIEPTGRDAAGVAAASATRPGRQFLLWSRFPRFVTQRFGDSIRVIMSDARYANPGGGSWASVTVTVPAP
ncbi:MAG TPA: metal-dependent hydrolase [Gemmatimonadales bacterium]|nr:metal-dependent hydrolase [Gemmatimonadales bacterium]